MTKTFRDLGVDPALCDALAEGGITHPFPIQELTLPLALDGHDLIGQARTGTGKTLAFGLPLLQRLDPASKHTQALVIVPTRELCLQVYSDLQIGSAKGLTSISVYGGVGYDEQIDALTAGAHVVVGTPGRLLDLLNRGVLDLSHVTQLVLDEADEMLDMGFLPDVERLVESCTGDDRHTMLFSATMPTAIVKLARRYMDHPTFTRADHEQKNTAPLVTQYFFEVHRMDKPRLLARILQSKDRGGVYVFVRTKHMADRLVNDLEELKIPSIAIHGDLRQSTREKNLDRFRSGQATVLVCTEVAARGLDVSGVTHVVNYDCPDDEKMYLHRIGRTARAGEAGVAITFAEFNEIDRLNVIRKAVGAVDTEVRQIFSTSKQLVELFDLPEERPWDHLTTKAGSDAARAKRESRTDGKPKSGRSQEGRGGDHDARRSGRKGGGKDAEAPARDAKNDRSTKSESRAKSENRSKSESRTKDRSTATSDRSAKDQGSTPTSDRNAKDESAGTSERTAQSSGTTSGGRDASDSAGRGSSDDGSGTRTRTRTRTRARSSASTASRGSGSERSRNQEGDTSARSGDAGRSGRSNDGSRAKQNDAKQNDEAAETERSSSSTSSGGRQRARGNQRNRASSSTGSRRGDAQGDGARDDTGTGSGSEGSRGSGRAGGERGGSRSGSGQKQGSGERSRNGDKDRRDNPSRGGRSRGGSRDKRDSSRSSRGDRQAATDPTVKVAGRGEDARGEGQPQISRRVKVEHLP